MFNIKKNLLFLQASSAPGSPYRLLWDGKVEMPYSDFPFDRLVRTNHFNLNCKTLLTNCLN